MLTLYYYYYYYLSNVSYTFGAQCTILRKNSSSHAQNYLFIAMLLHWLQCIRCIMCGLYKVI